jgi:hypothetical protein
MVRTWAAVFLTTILTFGSLAEAASGQWSMATARDIERALGPDAQGLVISSDTLPDLFDLTASRLDENPKNFVVAQKYTEGRWAGGMAVIEYARDLSYTLVSVYDKKGKRQRIYSVKASPREMSATEVARSKRAMNTVDVEMVQTEEPVDNHVVDLEPTVETASAKTSAPKPEKPRGKKTEAPAKPVEVASARVQPAAQATSGGSSSVWMPTPSAGSTRSSKEREVADTAAVQPGAAYEWDEVKGAYVPSKSGSAPASKRSSPTPAEPVVQSIEPTDVPEEPKSKRRGRKSKEDVQVAKATPRSEPAVSAPVESSGGGVWLPKPSASPSGKSAPVSSADIPSTEELLAEPTPSESASSRSERPSRSEPERGRKSKSAVSEAVDLEPAGYEPPAAKPTRQAAAAETPSELAAAQKWMKQNKSRVEEPPMVEAPPEPVVEEDVKPITTMTPSERAAAEAAKRAKEPRSPRQAAPKPRKGEKAPQDDMVTTYANSSGPDTAESDGWVPKKHTPVSIEPEIDEAPARTQVASIPKSSPPPDESLEAIMKIAEKNQKVNAESDAWVPKKVVLPKADQDLATELKKVQAESHQRPAPRQQYTVRRDVNNPEEGVMPVNSFEKFSGPRYGRHREYERRFFYGKRPKAPVQDYDFYVDEVDRKKEIHNVYYYKKGKAPKLVAVQRHTKVTFLSNWDVDKEDAGKVTTY